MLNVLIGIAIVAAIGFAAFRAADHVITLRRDREALQRDCDSLKDGLTVAHEHIQALEMQLKSIEQRTMADIDRDIFRDFRR